MQSKEGVQCFTDGCTGQVKLAQELEEEAGIDTHRRELLRLPDQAKKAERPPPVQEQPEQRRGRKKGPIQRVPEPGQPLSASVTADRDDGGQGASAHAADISTDTEGLSECQDADRGPW